MFMNLQERYNKNRLMETKQAHPQSHTFFHLWRTQGLWQALKWFHSFKVKRQHLSYGWVRVTADILGSFLVALGITGPIVLWLVITVGGSNDYAGEG